MSEVISSIADGVLRLKLNRSKKYNALTGDMYRALTIQLEQAQSNDDVSVILLSGAGDHFCAGNDIADFVQFIESQHDSELPATGFIRNLAGNSKPLVVAVQGQCVGVGATLTLHADAVYASPTTVFSVPFVDLGVVSEAGSSLLLPRRIGDLQARQMILGGKPLKATDPASHGLFTEITENHLEQAIACAKNWANKPTEAIQSCRQLLNSDSHLVRERLERESAEFQRLLASEECQARLNAFLKRRG